MLYEVITGQPVPLYVRDPAVCVDVVQAEGRGPHERRRALERRGHLCAAADRHEMRRRAPLPHRLHGGGEEPRVVLLAEHEPPQPVQLDARALV